MTERSYFSELESPVGKLTITASDSAYTGVLFETSRDDLRDAAAIRDDERCAEARAQLEAYFRGERTTFDLALDLRGTPFQVSVWRALVEIPFGTTVSYGELARTIRKPEAVRAVGAANGRNRVVIIVPCHRVIGADGSLTGFGGGLPRKRLLLDLERGVAAKKGLGAPAATRHERQLALPTIARSEIGRLAP